MRSMLLATAILQLLLSGCAQEPAEELEIELVEIKGAPTDMLTPEADAVEQRGAGNFAGQLPQGFPSDLPVPSSSSVLRKARGTVVFGTADTVEQARNALDRELRRAGWQQAGAEGWSRAGRRVEISYAPNSEGTAITYRY